MNKKLVSRFTVFGGLLAICLAISTGLPACQTSQAGQSTPERIDRDSLVQFFRQQGEMLVIYATQEGKGPAYANWLSGLSFGRYSIKAVADTAVDPLELAQKPHFLMGSFQHHALMREWADALPFEVKGEVLHFATRKLDQVDQILQCSFLPSPVAEGVPMGILTAYSDTVLLNLLQNQERQGWEGPIWSQWGYQVFDDHQRIMMGMFDENWRPGGKPHWDFSAQPVPDYESEYLRVYQQQSRLSVAELRVIALQVETRIANLRKWLGDSLAPFAPVNYRLYPSAERMGLMRNRQVHAYAEKQRRETHRIFNDHYRDLGLIPHQDLLPFIRQALPTPNLPILEEGLAVYFTPQWQREGFRYWAGRLAAGQAHLSLEHLMEEGSYQTRSPLIKEAMAGALVDFLQETWGKERFLARYASWQPSSADYQELAPKWKGYLQKLAAEHPLKAWKGKSLNYYAGMTLAHEGYRIYNGYGSDSARHALSKLSSLHVNSIALVPYTGTRNRSKPSPFRVSQGAGGENDAAVIASFRHAKDLNMQVLMKPQIWFPGSWPGGVEMSNEADWKLWFQNYHEWIAHYALLSAIHEVDVFCAGVEFAKATLSHPQAWSDMIKNLRQIYPGPVTYAANWGNEAEKLAFGHELDFIGVNCYYPLSDKEEASKAELTAGFARIKRKLEAIHQRHRVPIVLTEVGFRCVEGAWRNPHAETEGRSFDEQAQKLGYEVVFEGLADADWCHGMFWWKWPSYLGYAQRNLTSFTPCHRPAMAVIEKWYGRR